MKNKPIQDYNTTTNKPGRGPACGSQQTTTIARKPRDPSLEQVGEEVPQGNEDKEPLGWLPVIQIKKKASESRLLCHS